MLLRTKKAGELLRYLKEICPEIDSSILISRDGIVLATDIDDEARKERFSLMIASLLSLGEHVTDDLSIGRLRQIFIRGANGYVLLMSVKDRGILCALVSGEAKLGSVFLDMNRIIEMLSQQVYPISYGTALLNPDILSEYERSQDEVSPEEE
jgi:predicted regulator of Ras-like GTPase activity (Roadblock/LC7/MglB family)